MATIHFLPFTSCFRRVFRQSFTDFARNDQKTRESCGCPNSLLEKFSGKFRRCWKNPPRFSGSTKCYPCQGFGIFRQGKRLLENWPRLRERCWIFSSETATAFLSSSETRTPDLHNHSCVHYSLSKLNSPANCSLIEDPSLVYPYPKKHPKLGPWSEFPSPETQTMV